MKPNPHLADEGECITCGSTMPPREEVRCGCLLHVCPDCKASYIVRRLRIPTPAPKNGAPSCP